jgi:hypothetical protein
VVVETKADRAGDSNEDRYIWFDGTGWATKPLEGELVLLSTNNEFDTEAINRGASLLGELATYREVALNYVHTHGQSVWLEQDGNLELEAIDITELPENKFGMTFGVIGQPDFTITVEFENEHPIDVWGAD